LLKLSKLEKRRGQDSSLSAQIFNLVTESNPANGGRTREQSGVRSKKFEQISPKICRAGGIPPKPPFRPPAEATLSDWTI